MNSIKLIFFIVAFLCKAAAFSQDVEIEITNVCSGTNSGAIEITVLPSSNTIPPYSFLWTDSEGNVLEPELESEDGFSRISNLFDGQYCVLVTSLSDGCQIETCDLIVEDLTPIITITPTCICPNGYGALSVEVSGGSGNYGYAWSGPGAISNPTIPNPLITATGAYTVTVTDSQTGCEATAQATVTQCDVNLANNIQITPDCNEAGTSTLSIQLPTGYGLAPFEFKWIKVGFGLVETDASTDGFASLENAEPGEYCLSFLTMNGCSDQICDINVTPQPKPNIDYTVTPVTNGSDGAIALNVTGQPGPFSYLWNTGQETPNLAGLGEGSYSVTVTDGGSGCTNSTDINLLSCIGLQEAIGDLLAEVTAITILNGGQTLGSINITNVQDQFPGYDFNFVWINQFGEIISNLEDLIGQPSGSYNVAVTSDDCPGLTINGEWEICQFALEFAQTNTNCSSTTLLVTPSSSGNYAYKWNTGAISPGITASLGTEYCVTVTLVGGCVASACYTPLAEPLTAMLVNQQNATYGNSNGSIEVMATGSNPPYQYNWSNGMTGAFISGLAPGPYTVTVTDACGKTTVEIWYIQCEFGQNDIQGNVINVACGTNTPGAITLTQLPNVGDFKYLWSNNETTQNISNLAAGEYTVTLTEVITGCIAVRSFTVGTSGSGNFTVAFDMQPGCYPLNEGTLTAIPSNPAFNYSWGTWSWGPPPSFGNTATIINVPAGWYGVVVTDVLGCTASNQTLMWPAMPTFSVTANASPGNVCPGVTATGTVEVIGASGPLSFTWTNFSNYPSVNIVTNEPELEGIGQGNWAVTVLDSDGCQNTAVFSISQSNIMIFDDINQSCNRGSVNLTPRGGLAPYSYSWSNGETTSFVDNLDPGNYSVTITDAAGCTKTKDYVILKTPAPVITIHVIHAPFYPVPGTGAAGAAVEGGTEPYSYLWSTGATENLITNVEPGNYLVTVTDGEGCTSVAEAQINYITPLNILFNPLHDLTSCAAGAGKIDIHVTGVCTPFTFTWSGPPGFQGASTEDLIGISISGTYCVTVQDDCGQVKTKCVEMECNCSTDNSVAPRFWIQNACLENGLWDDGTADIDLHSLHNPLWNNNDLTYYINFYKLSGFSPELIAKGEVYGKGQDWDVVSGTDHIEVGAGEYLVTVINPFNCVYTYYYYFQESNGCQNYYNAYTLGGTYNNPNLNDYGFVLYLCGRATGYCGEYNTPFGNGSFYEDEIVTEPFDYYPCDPADPCNSGGYLRCGSQCDGENPVFYGVPAGIGGELIQVTNNKCGCLFPAGMIPEFQNEPFPVFGEINCTNPTLAGVEFLCPGEEITPGTPGVPDPVVECPSECHHCEAVVNESDCTTEYYCMDISGNQVYPTPVKTFDDYALCRSYEFDTGTNTGYFHVYQYCIHDLCNLTYLGSLTVEEAIVTINENLLSWLSSIGVIEPETKIDENFKDESQIAGGQTTWEENVLSVIDIPSCGCGIHPLIVNDGPSNSISDGGVSRLEATPGNSSLEGIESAAFPNPFTNAVTLKVKVDKEVGVKVCILDAIGRVLSCEWYQGQKGLNEYSISFANLILPEHGLFYVQISDERGNLNSHKLVRME